ncbi:hypothetical protein [Magnetospirillum fulvum]|uniref:Uncharacterized protein n=1 Tax=Magnetospirillum fulvum TaxID=1082 RepID=A0A1H6HDI6_MAGFU|nr:hypothetical protein [Magnetospirillum fulvum]SEH33907.1 hypothetical protein SAMN04244559_01471 [Magnetospirillum fulvum]
MKALKALVIFLGVLIVAGVGLVIYGIASKVGPKPAPTASTAAAVPTPPNAAAPLPAAPFGSVDIALPDGATIQQVFAAGDRVIVRVGGGKGTADRLIVLDPARGEVAGSFRFVASPVGEPVR